MLPDIIKIDVEGAEEMVLEGARGIMADHKPYVIIEVHPKQLRAFGSSVGRVISLLKSFDYEVEQVVNLRSSDSELETVPASASAITGNSTLCTRS